MKLTPCIETFFTDLPCPERIAKVKAAGFTACEFWDAAGKDLDAMAVAARKHGVRITSIVGVGHGAHLNDEAGHDGVIMELQAAIKAAQRLDCTGLIVLGGYFIPKMTRERQCANIIAGLRKLAPLADAAGVTLFLEYLNSAYDHPGYLLDNFAELIGILRAVDHAKVKALVDIYHAGIMEGNMIEKLRDSLDVLGHLHGAGIPGRHEMKNGEQNYPAICRALDDAGFKGYLGLEYFPLKDSMTSLIETREWIHASA